MVEALTIVISLALLLIGLVVGLWLGRKLAPTNAAAREEVVREAADDREKLLREFSQERERLQSEHLAAVESARKSSVVASRRSLTGQVAEKLAPHLPDFPYDVTELRFLGSPVDYVVFKGLAADKVEEIIFLEVKTAKSNLSSRERSLRNAIQGAKVRWDIYRVDVDTTEPDPKRINVNRVDGP